VTEKQGDSWFSRLFGRTTPPDGTFAARVEPPVVAQMPLPSAGDTVEGKHVYSLGRPLGEGGYGTVILGRPVGDPEGVPAEVAIKLLSPRLAHKTRRDALRRELSSLLAVEHPAIPRVFDWQIDGEHPFVVMEFFPLGNLQELLEREGMLPDDVLVRLLEDLLGALSAARRACLLHLDIKPANVLLREDGGFALTDFGTAQAALAGEDVLGHSSKGTRGYQAPEQARRGGGPLDLRTDLFGVGTTVWAAATGMDLASPRGQRLFASCRDGAQTLPPVADLRPMVPPVVDRLLAPLLAREPADRPADPASVLTELHDASRDRAHADRQRGHTVTEADAQAVHEALIDPLWSHVLQGDARADLLRFGAGEVIVDQGDSSHRAYLLLQGEVRVSRDGAVLAIVRREGTFLGEVAALTGGVRTARMEAVDTATLMVLDLMALERLVTQNPAVGVRLIHSMADRLAQQSGG
jgi:hypothetical protein